MNSSNQDNGDQPEKNLLVAPRNYSVIDLFHGERWLMESGIFTESTADTLMGYGYMVPDVRKVDMEIDLDTAHNGQNPSVKYLIRLSFKKRFLLRRASSAQAQGGLLGKLKLFCWIKLGAPVPGQLEAELTRMAQEFLPSTYKISVNLA